VEKVEPLFSIFGSPGALSEEVHLYLGIIDATHRVSNGGGLDHEFEDIEVVELPLGDAFNMISSGEITDAKTIILLQWAVMNRARLKA
jgi:hypothetical protein